MLIVITSSPEKGDYISDQTNPIPEDSSSTVDCAAGIMPQPGLRPYWIEHSINHTIETRGEKNWGQVCHNGTCIVNIEGGGDGISILRQRASEDRVVMNTGVWVGWMDSSGGGKRNVINRGTNLKEGGAGCGRYENTKVRKFKVVGD
ncbi:hypothetical protein Ahia01_000108000 [Argonauta hians]